MLFDRFASSSPARFRGHAPVGPFLGLLCLWLSLSGFRLDSDQPTLAFEHLSVEEGLSNSHVNAIQQDSQGLLWFATTDGLNRFNGYEMAVFRHDPEDSFSIAGNWISNVEEDVDGNLWVRFGIGGLDLWSRDTERFYHFHSDPEDSTSLPATEVFSILRARTGGIWILTPQGLAHGMPSRSASGEFSVDFTRIDGLAEATAITLGPKGRVWVGTRQRQVFRERDNETGFDRVVTSSTEGPGVHSLLVDSQERLWIACGGQGLSTSSPSDTLTRIPGPAEFTALKMQEDSQGRIWILADRDQVYRYDPGTNSWSRYTNPGGPAASGLAMAADEQGRIVIGTGGGLAVYVADRDEFALHRHRASDPRSLSYNQVTDLFTDDDGDLWVGTHGGGVCRLDEQANRFGHHRLNDETLNTPAAEVVTTIVHGPSGDLWLGTAFGAVRYDLNSGFVSRHDLTQGGASPISLYPASDGFWMTSPSRIARVVSTSPFAVDRLSTSLEPGANVGCLLETRANVLWVGTRLGLYKKGPDDQRLRRWEDDTTPPFLTRSQVVALAEDSKGNLWVGSFRGGLSRIESGTGQVQHYVYDESQPQSLNSKSVTSIYVDSKDRIWVGTYSGGLNLFDPLTETFSAYTERNGLAGSKVNGILEDDSGCLWVSTNHGISRFDPDSESFRNFDSEDGLQSNEFSMGAAFSGEDEVLYFGGIHGFNRFRPSDLGGEARPPRVILTGFRKFDKAHPLSTVRSDQADIDLSHHDRFISFEFVGLNYGNPERTQYSYQLAGFDPDWVNSGSRRYAAYTNLDPGSYTFYVRAAHGQGTWSEPAIGLTVRVRPPFYRTAWFYALLGGLLISGLWLAHVLRVRHKIQQSVTLERVRFAERDRLREQISQDYHDELGHKLTKISIFSELIKRNLNGQENGVVPYIDKVTESVATLTRATRDFIWTLNPHRDSLYDLALHLQEFGIGLFEDTEIDFRVAELAPSMREISLSIEWKRHLILMFQEVLHNSLRHADCSTVTLSFSVETGTAGSRLRISVTDDGRGFEKSNTSGETPGQESGGQGIANIHRRATALGGAISITSTSGTHVEFCGDLPLLSPVPETEVSS